VHVATLSITDFRCYETAVLSFPSGVTVIVGGNGAGKTSLLEALAWAALGRSFRGVHDSALVRTGAEQAILRVEVDANGAAAARRRLVEAEIRPVGRNRVLVDRSPLVRTRDLLGALRVTVFAPDDLTLVKGGPAGRRAYLDDLLVALSPRYEAVRTEYDGVVRHRNALLKGGVRGAEARATLDVFDDQLVKAGAELVAGRLDLVARLAPRVDAAYRALAPDEPGITARYEAEWAEGAVPAAAAVPELLRAALVDRRSKELDRGITLVGPHRDEWRLDVGGLDSRTHASQGEQRTLSLALRLGGHHVCAEVLDEDPVLLLDDVFSELDPRRAEALVAELPGGQTVITTAGAVPAAVHPEQHVRVEHGRVEPT
jgi:DNA replication and repair protein RecF